MIRQENRGMAKIEISGTGLPGGTTIRMDGQDIAPALRGLTLAMDAEELPTLQLNLACLEIEQLTLDGVRVMLPTATRDLLISLGWTPPEGD